MSKTENIHLKPINKLLSICFAFLCRSKTQSHEITILHSKAVVAVFFDTVSNLSCVNTKQLERSNVTEVDIKIGMHESNTYNENYYQFTINDAR